MTPKLTVEEKARRAEVNTLIDATLKECQQQINRIKEANKVKLDTTKDITEKAKRAENRKRERKAKKLEELEAEKAAKKAEKQAQAEIKATDAELLKEEEAKAKAAKAMLPQSEKIKLRMIKLTCEISRMEEANKILPLESRTNLETLVTKRLELQNKLNAAQAAELKKYNKLTPLQKIFHEIERLEGLNEPDNKERIKELYAETDRLEELAQNAPPVKKETHSKKEIARRAARKQKMEAKRHKPAIITT